MEIFSLDLRYLTEISIDLFCKALQSAPQFYESAPHFYEHRELTASSRDYAMLQMSAIQQTVDLNAFHRSPGVLGQEVSDFPQFHVMGLRFSFRRNFVQKHKFTIQRPQAQSRLFLKMEFCYQMALVSSA